MVPPQKKTSTVNIFHEFIPEMNYSLNLSRKYFICFEFPQLHCSIHRCHNVLSSNNEARKFHLNRKFQFAIILFCNLCFENRNKFVKLRVSTEQKMLPAC